MMKMNPKLMAIQDLKDMLEGEMNSSLKKPKALSVTKISVGKPKVMEGEMESSPEDMASDEQLLRSQHGDEKEEGEESLSDDDVRGLEELLKQVLKK